MYFMYSTNRAYNLGTMLRYDPTSRGLFYFVACFFPIQQLWQYKMYYDARFYTGAYVLFAAVGCVTQHNFQKALYDH